MKKNDLFIYSKHQMLKALMGTSLGNRHFFQSKWIPVVILMALSISSAFAQAIKFKKYENLSGSTTGGFNTGYSTLNWDASIVGFSALDGDILEDGSGDIIQCYMYEASNQWHIRLDFRTHNNNEEWDVEVMFTRKAFSNADPNTTYEIPFSNDNITGVNQLKIADPGEGVNFHDAGRIYIVDDATDDKFYIGPGKVGIGTTSPSQQLEVNGGFGLDGILSMGRHGSLLSGNTDPYRISINDDSSGEDLILYGTSTDNTLNLRLYDGSLKLGSPEDPNTEIFNDGSAFFGGNIGIGTDTPDAALHVVNGNIRAGSTSENYTEISHGGSHGYINTVGEGNLDFRHDATTYMSLTEGGYLGIGTASPETPLAIQIDESTHPVGITQGAVGGTATLELTTTDEADEQATRFLLRGTTDAADIEFYRGARESETLSMIIEGENGHVGIGTDDPQGALDVKGTVTAVRFQALPESDDYWPDYVFEENYALPSLQEVEKHINRHHHLPGVPSAQEVGTNGIDLVQMQATQLQKIEELTLYMIALKKENEQLKKEMKEIRAAVKR